MAAALGARVIKLEDGNGDPHRQSFGPDVGDEQDDRGQGEHLDQPEDGRGASGRPAHLRQRGSCSSPASAPGSRRSSGWATSSCANSTRGSVYVHAAGYGIDGPYAHRALYAQAAQSVGGSFGRQVGYWSEPERNIDLSLIELQAIVIPRLGQVVDGDSNPALDGARHLGPGHVPPAPDRRRAVHPHVDDLGKCLGVLRRLLHLRGKPPAPISDEEYWGVSALDRVYPAAEDTYVCLAVYEDRRVRRASQRRSASRNSRAIRASLRWPLGPSTTKRWSRPSRRACSSVPPPSGSRR